MQTTSGTALGETRRSPRHLLERRHRHPTGAAARGQENHRPAGAARPPVSSGGHQQKWPSVDGPGGQQLVPRCDEGGRLAWAEEVLRRSRCAPRSEASRRRGARCDPRSSQPGVARPLHLFSPPARPRKSGRAAAAFWSQFLSVPIGWRCRWEYRPTALGQCSPVLRLPPILGGSSRTIPPTVPTWVDRLCSISVPAWIVLAPRPKTTRKIFEG